MHHFFLEKFLEPSQWFRNRLNYSRSVAVNSMVGYIVGLGDRHISNILLDHKTAEIIQIDMGVVFEQGKLLRTPEVVPFRLTRDLVDGLGVTGVEGVFRTCCEHTLNVLRAKNNQELLLMILQVFLHDPLYRWTQSPLKAQRARLEELDIEELLNIEENKGITDMNQRTQARKRPEDSNTDAERALLRVREKLQGYVERDVLSVEGQVQKLIEEATDANRLCKMFAGWASWV